MTENEFAKNLNVVLERTKPLVKNLNETFFRKTYKEFQQAYNKKDYETAFGIFTKNSEIMKHFSNEEYLMMEEIYKVGITPAIKEIKSQLEKKSGVEN